MVLHCTALFAYQCNETSLVSAASLIRSVTGHQPSSGPRYEIWAAVMRCWGPGTLLLVLHTAAAAVYRFPPCACGRELTQPSSLRPAAQGHCSHHHAAHCHHCHGLTASLRRLGSPCVARPAASVLAGAVLCSAVSRASCGSGAGYWQTGASAGSTARHPHAALPPRGPTGEYRHRHTVTPSHCVTPSLVWCHVSRVRCHTPHAVITTAHTRAETVPTNIQTS